MRLYQHDHTELFNEQNPVIIYAFADTHIGSLNFDEDLLKNHIEQCKKEEAYWVHLGDWCEAITPKDPRFDIRFSTLNHVTEQYGLAKELFEPIKDKCLGVLAGNHDEKISKDVGDLLQELTLNPLGITNQYLGVNGFINLRLYRVRIMKNPQYQIGMYLTHGYGKGRLIGSKAIQLQRLSHSFEADIYLVGHLHTSITHTDEVYYLKRRTRLGPGRRVSSKYRYYIAAPSYFKAYMMDSDSYAEKGAYPPQPTGCERILIKCVNESTVLGATARDKRTQSQGFSISSRTLHY